MWIVVQIDISRRKSVVEFLCCHFADVIPLLDQVLIHSDNLHLLVDAFKLLTTFKVIIDVIGLIATTFVTTIDPRQCWFQLHGSTYTWILFNSKYHSITWSVESTDAGAYKLRADQPPLLFKGSVVFSVCCIFSTIL